MMCVPDAELVSFHLKELAKSVSGAEVALAEGVVGDAGVGGDLVEGAAFELGGGEKSGFVGAEGAGLDGALEDEGRIVLGPVDEVPGDAGAMVYPTLLATIGDVAHPRWRASSIGVYRLWRDGGFAVGALLAGVVADLLGLAAAIWVVAALTAASGVVAVRMYETHRRTPAAPGREDRAKPRPNR